MTYQKRDFRQELTDSIIPDSEVKRLQTIITHCALLPCPFRAAVFFYSSTQGGGASAFALG